MSAKAPGDTIDKQRASSEQGPSEAAEHSAKTLLPASWWNFHTIAFLVGFLALLGLIAFSAMNFLKTADGNIIEINGRIEAPETHISAVAATKVKSVLVREGDNVNKGQLLVQLDTAVIQAKAGSLQKFMSQAARARQQADLHAAAVSRQVAAARRKSTGFWTKVFTSPEGRAKKGEQLRGEMLQARLMQMQAGVAVARAKSMSSAVASAKTNFNLTSPIAGVIETRSIEPGELVAPGQVLLTVVDPKGVYMKGYIPEGDVGKIKIGQEANVYLDSDSKKGHPAHITAIDSAPSFTPENVYFKDDRVRQVFGVKLNQDRPDGLAKPGMSAEAKIKLKRQSN
jgi:multidrug resistance efflux pump